MFIAGRWEVCAIDCSWKLGKVRVHSLLSQYGSPRSNSCEYWWQGPLLTELYYHPIYFILNDNNWQNKNWLLVFLSPYFTCNFI